MNYQQNIEELLKHLNSKEEGLSTKEAIFRLAKFGPNVLPSKKPPTILALFIGEFLNPISYIMIAASFFSFVVGESIDGLAIIFILLVDAIMGTIEEYRANKSAEALSNMIKIQVKVIRDSKEVLLPSESIVPGDVIILDSGTKLTADARLLTARNLTVNESVLNGESVAANKKVGTISKEVNLSERYNMVYSGTSVLTGRATAIVCNTGIKTELGTIAKTVLETKSEDSPLTIRMNKFSKQIALSIIILAIIITVILLSKETNYAEIFLSVIALSVSAMPEGLPLALTLALTIGSTKMAKQNVIVKKLNAVEALGSCTIIASDKTGTLTVNEQTAKKIIFPDNSIIDITGSGYNDSGKLVGSNISLANLLAYLGYINNEAQLVKENNEWHNYGDSIDIAFLALAYKAGINQNNPQILGSIPYESENKYSAVFYQTNDGIHVTVKGSPETVLSFCSTMQTTKKEKIDTALINHQNQLLAAEGYRVIAIAEGIIENAKKENNYSSKDLTALNFIGLTGFIDPIRPEVLPAIKSCHNAGIKVLMITGDQPLTAYKIAQDLSLVSNYEEVCDSLELAKVYEQDHDHFFQFIQTKTVFARITPIQKYQIVSCLEQNNEFVAVTGDGVNDAPALKAANIGIAMGSGTDVAKETAQMIITDDNFTSIVAGIKEGRIAYNNIRKVSYYLLSCGLAEVIAFLLSIISNLPMPLIAIQLLWLNVVTDGLQDLALSFEKENEDIMALKPRHPKESLFNKQFINETLLSGIYIGLIIFFTWFILLNHYHFEVATSRGYIMTIMVFIQNFHVLNARSETTSVFKISLFKNPFVIFSILSSIILQIIVMEIPFLTTIFSTTSIHPFTLLLLALLSSTILILMELFKLYQNGKIDKRVIKK